MSLHVRQDSWGSTSKRGVLEGLRPGSVLIKGREGIFPEERREKDQKKFKSGLGIFAEKKQQSVQQWVTRKVSLLRVSGRDTSEWERDKIWVSLTRTLIRGLSHEGVRDIMTAGIVERLLYSWVPALTLINSRPLLLLWFLHEGIKALNDEK